MQQLKQYAKPLALKMMEETTQGMRGMLLWKLKMQGNRFFPKASRESEALLTLDFSTVKLILGF